MPDQSCLIIPVEEFYDRLLDKYEQRYAYGVDTVDQYIANMMHMGFEEDDIRSHLDNENEEN